MLSSPMDPSWLRRLTVLYKAIPTINVAQRKVVVLIVRSTSAAGKPREKEHY